MIEIERIKRAYVADCTFCNKKYMWFNVGGSKGNEVCTTCKAHLNVFTCDTCKQDYITDAHDIVTCSECQQSKAL